jgi:hypothetical protein
MTERRPRELAGLAAVGLTVCCGLPVLLGAGALSAAIGIALGSTFVAVLGVAVGIFGLQRWRHRQACQHRAET